MGLCPKLRKTGRKFAISEKTCQVPQMSQLTHTTGIQQIFLKARFSHGKMIYMWVLQIGGYDSHRLNVYPK